MFLQYVGPDVLDILVRHLVPGEVLCVSILEDYVFA